MELAEIHRIERAKWDAAAAAGLDRSAVLAPDVTLESQLGASVVNQGVVEFLGDLAGQQVLEFGCGLGKNTVLLARTGAKVTSFDLSPGSVEITRQRLELNGLADRVELQVAAGEALPFADDRFDVVFGQAILHHLDPALAAPELHRVVRPGGRAAFSEPLGMNPVLNLVRDRVPYRHKHERGADQPLREVELAQWRAGWSSFEMRPVQLLSMVERGFGFGRRMPRLRRADETLLRRFPSLGRYCRYAVLQMVK